MTEQRRFYKYKILMIMMLCAAFLLYPAHMVSAKEGAAREVIRVGYFAFDGYHTKRYIDAMNGEIQIQSQEEIGTEIEVTILQEAGFLVDQAVDGQEAVDKVKASSDGYYSGILMDIQMPVMDGYEATREIRKLNNPHLADTPIIAVSANALDEDKEASAEAGMDAHIEKIIKVKIQ